MTLPALCCPKNKADCEGSYLFRAGKMMKLSGGILGKQKSTATFQVEKFMGDLFFSASQAISYRRKLFDKKTTNRIVLCNPLTALAKPVIGRDALLISWQMVIWRQKLMFNFQPGGPIEFILSYMAKTSITPSVEQLQAEEPFLVGNYQNVAHKLYFEDRPFFSAFTFTFSSGHASVLQAFSWGFYSCFKVSTLACGYAGGILGGACGILKASQQRLAGEESQPFTKTIRDYAIRGKVVGTAYSSLVSVLPAIWLGIKVTVLAVPVLNVSVPLFAVLSALSGIEFAYRGNRSIGYRIIDKVFEYTLPFKYFAGLEKDIQMAEREQRVPLYSNLEVRDIPPGLQHPLPRRAVLCVSPAVLNENGITEQANYHVYDYETLRSAFLNEENYVFPHNREPIDWGLVFRLTNHSLQ